ncbi:MAG: phenylalanine--tRNA ligase subunit alpha, partial [Clostridia bacterium]
MEGLTQEEEAVLDEIPAVSTVEELERIRVEWLGRRGRVTEALRALGSLPADERRGAGQRLNRLRSLLEQGLQERMAELSRKELDARLQRERLDLTLPARVPPVGRLHPVTRTRRRLEDAMVRLGFSLFEGPHIESEWYNFEALNMPAEHPAREMHDTFYLSPPY